MLVITIIYSLLTILGIGSILNPILKKCDVLAKPIDENEIIEEEAGEKKKCCSNLKNCLIHFNQRYFAPIFIRSKETRSKNYTDFDLKE